VGYTSCVPSEAKQQLTTFLNVDFKSSLSDENCSLIAALETVIAGEGEVIVYLSPPPGFPERVPMGFNTDTMCLQAFDFCPREHLVGPG